MRLGFNLPLLLALMLYAQAGFAATLPEMPPRYVVDLAGVVGEGMEARLNGYLQELERKTTAQVIVLTVDSLEGVPLEEYSLQVAEKWRLGRKDRDNGVLIMFAMKERRYRFEVGYGLEGILPDSLVGSIGRDNVVPYFREGDYSGGVASAVLAVAGVIARDSGVEITGMARPKPRRRPDRKRNSNCAGNLALVFVLFILSSFVYVSLFRSGPRRRRGGSIYWSDYWMYSGRGSGGFGGGRGTGGFGGGGFGGGGGGGFGGGGASGGW